jgi:hypothetical protein
MSELKLRPPEDPVINLTGDVRKPRSEGLPVRKSAQALGTSRQARVPAPLKGDGTNDYRVDYRCGVAYGGGSGNSNGSFGGSLAIESSCG